MRDKLGETLKQRLWDEHQPDDEGRAPAPASLRQKLGQWVGGIVSLALVLGVVYWVFELGRRDATEVPVIRAMAGEARELPENSGGPQVDNQGLQVNEVLASDATAPVGPETTLAPPPQRVVPEDVAAPAEPQTAPILVPVTPTPDATPVLETQVETVAQAPLSPALLNEESALARPPRRSPPTALSTNADLLSDAIANAVLEATSESSTTATPPAPNPAPAPASFAGEKMIQLGAYDDEESANRDYDLLLEDNQDLLGGLERFVERREAGGRVFYRLRARGFADMDEATTMCTALLARSIQCIAVTAR